MGKIVIEKKPVEKTKAKRSAVIVKPETYLKVYELAIEVNMPIETLVDLLLTEALKEVEVKEC